MIPIVHRIAMPVTKPMISKMIPIAIMISPRRAMADLELAGSDIAGSDTEDAITSTGDTDGRGSLGGALRYRPVFCRESGFSNLSVLAVRPDGIAHYLGRDDRELTALGPRPRPELRVGVMRGEALLADEHALGLLDDGP